MATRNHYLAVEAENARRQAVIAAEEIRTLNMGIEVYRYELSDALIQSPEFQGLRADLRADLLLLQRIAERLSRAKILLTEQDGGLTHQQAVVHSILGSMHDRAGKVTATQAADLVDNAIRAFSPASPNTFDHDGIRAALFFFRDDQGEHILGRSVTLATVREAVLAAQEVTS